jgi:hypothetical protein
MEIFSAKNNRERNAAHHLLLSGRFPKTSNLIAYELIAKGSTAPANGAAIIWAGSL